MNVTCAIRKDKVQLTSLQVYNVKFKFTSTKWHIFKGDMTPQYTGSKIWTWKPYMWSKTRYFLFFFAKGKEIEFVKRMKVILRNLEKYFPYIRHVDVVHACFQNNIYLLWGNFRFPFPLYFWYQYLFVHLALELKASIGNVYTTKVLQSIFEESVL